MYKVRIRKRYPTGWGAAPGWWVVSYFYRYKDSDTWTFMYHDICDSWPIAMKVTEKSLKSFKS